MRKETFYPMKAGTPLVLDINGYRLTLNETTHAEISRIDTGEGLAKRVHFELKVETADFVDVFGFDAIATLAAMGRSLQTGARPREVIAEFKSRILAAQRTDVAAPAPKPADDASVIALLEAKIETLEAEKKALFKSVEGTAASLTAFRDIVLSVQGMLEEVRGKSVALEEIPTVVRSILRSNVSPSPAAPAEDPMVKAMRNLRASCLAAFPGLSEMAALFDEPAMKAIAQAQHTSRLQDIRYNLDEAEAAFQQERP